MSNPMRPVAAFRRRLVNDAALQALVGVDSDPDTGARVYPKSLVDVEEPVYPCITLFLDRSRMANWTRRTIDPGYMLIEFWSKVDEAECYAMYEIVTQLLHDQKTALSTAEFCCHFVQEVDAQGALFQKTRSVWRSEALYKFRGSILT